MPLFTPPVARPGLPYRQTGDALALAGIAFLGSLFLMANLLSSWRPFQNATLFQHFSGLLTVDGKWWLATLRAHPLVVGGWYLLILGVAAGGAVASFLYANREIQPFIHVRGRRLLRGKPAIIAALKASRKAISDGGTGLQIAPNLTLGLRQEGQSILVAGVQGGGKTVVINNILQPALLRNDKMVVFDLTKGDYTSILPSRYKRDLVILSPWDRRSSVWAIGRDLTRLQDATAFAAGLIQETDRDPMWSNAARGILIAGILFLIDQYGKQWGWRELAGYCRLGIEKQKEIVDSYFTPASASVADAESKTTQSIKINLDAFLLPIWDLARRWGEKEKQGGFAFSLSDWLANDQHRTRKILIHGNAADPLLTGSFGRAVSEYLTSQIASLEFPESKTRKIWFFLDELPQIGRLTCISRLLEIGRSKGVSCVFGFQVIDHIRQLYPNHEAEKWMGLFGIKIFPQVKGSSSQEWVIKEVGLREVERRHRTVGSGKNSSLSDSYQRQEIPVIYASQLETEIGPGRAGVDALVIGHSSDALILQFPFPKLKKIRRGFEAAPEPRISPNPPISAAEAAEILGIEPVIANSDVGHLKEVDEVVNQDLPLPMPAVPDVPVLLPSQTDEQVADEVLVEHDLAELLAEEFSDELAEAAAEHVADAVGIEQEIHGAELVSASLKLLDALEPPPTGNPADVDPAPPISRRRKRKNRYEQHGEPEAG